jgi:SHS2 domain-containing protein
MREFEFIAHRADVALLARGDTLENLFLAALQGMNQILKQGFCESRHPIAIRQKLFLRSVDFSSLLIDFLSEVLTLSYEEKAVFCQVDSLNLSPHSLQAEIGGSRVNQFDEDIKAVTYHQAEIQKKGSGYEIQIIFDI